ncbi:MAG: hypothetical protein KAG61_02090 [Bacteriovoracaceae bacterium]|nr:hypothetical protein [Bacteriovoracaceae bacterium]
MFMAVAVETSKHPQRKNDYKIWYLELNDRQSVVGIGVKSKDEVLEDLFSYYSQTGKTNWRAFERDSEVSTKIEVFDFIAISTGHNTHFGKLPTLSEFQKVLSYLQMNLEVRAIA